MPWSIPSLGTAQVPSPVATLAYISDADPSFSRIQVQLPTLEKAGPRSHLFFDPSKVTAGIVTCGGLCPALNDVIRSLVNTLYYKYGVKKVLGFKYGYSGLNPATSVGDFAWSCFPWFTVHKECRNTVVAIT